MVVACRVLLTLLFYRVIRTHEVESIYGLQANQIAYCGDDWSRHRASYGQVSASSVGVRSQGAKYSHGGYLQGQLL